MNECPRRTFLKAAALGAARIALGAPASAADSKPSASAWIDCHTHFYDPTRPQGVPWPDKNDKQLYRPVLPKDFLAVARPLGVGRTVVVEASPWLEDNQWLLDLAAKEPSIVGVVGRLEPGGEAFARHLQRFAPAPLFRGIRVGKDQVAKGLDQPGFVGDLERLAEQDRALDVNGGPDMPALVARLARRLPRLRIVINHAANLGIDGQAVPADWLRGMRAAAEQPNVFCKVSALVEGTGKTGGKAPAEVAFYRPVLDALWDTFGGDRLLYGSNWPVSEPFAPYATVFRIVAAYFQARGKDVAERFFVRNAATAYKWVER